MFKIKLIILFIFILIFIFIFNNFVYAQATEKNDKQKIVLENDFLVLINNDFDEKNINKNVAEFNLLATYLNKQNKQTRRSEYKKIITDILATEGYFLPEIKFQRNAENKKLNIIVSLNKPSKINSINIEFQNENGIYLNKNSAKYQELIKDIPLQLNSIFKQTDWDNTKQLILNKLLQKEYYQAHLENSLADVDSENNSVNIYLFYKTGYSYRFGDLKITGLYRYNDELVNKYNQKIIQKNDIYNIRRINRFQNKLQNSPYFSSARISLDIQNSKSINNIEKNNNTDDENFAKDNIKIADVIVNIREKPAHNLSFGIGYSTNTGARLDNRYQTANFLNEALSLETNISLEQKRQTILADMFFSPTKKRHQHGIGMIAEHSDIEGLNIKRYAIGWQNIIQRKHLETRWSLTFLKENYTTSTTQFLDLERNTKALVPNVQWTWRNVDNRLNPTSGEVLRLQIGLASKAFLSDANFVRLHLKGMHFYSFNQNNIFTFTYEFGKTISFEKKDDRNDQNYSNNKIPQDYLFRTGGTGSIRGYDYQSIGIKSGSATLGAKNLALTSMQFLHWFDKQWGSVVFIDAGNAWDDNANKTEKNIAVGYGVGARWKSPAGPLGLDIAYGKRSKKLQFHFALNIPF